jgi:Alpha galactosidase C-terminal beta sandwich domain
LTTVAGQAAAQSFLTNPAMDDVARIGNTFTPVEGNTGSSAANMFVRQDGNTWCIAVFNYGSSSVNRTVDLNRAGLPPGNYLASNLWDGTTLTVSGSFNVNLNAAQSKLFRVALPPPPVISSVTVSGGSLVFTGTNGIANGSYTVLVSTNIATASANWTALMTNSFDASGSFHVTNIVSSGNLQQFYRIQLDH